MTSDTTLKVSVPDYSDMPKFGFREMVGVVEVANYESVTRAAARLNFSQPGLTRLVLRVEKEMGFAIFKRNRTGRSMTLTSRGIYVFQHFYKAVNTMMHLMHEEPVG
jgi:DNA-binding transcriptional LysR family regulator